MKKFIASILAMLYLTVSSGAVVHMHYCMDKLVEVDLLQSNAKQCDNCGMKKTLSEKTGCCSDQNKVIKLDIDHKVSDTSVQFSKLLGQGVWVPYLDNYLIYFSSVTEKNPNGNSPPLYSGTAIYKQNCVFRI